MMRYDDRMLYLKLKEEYRDRLIAMYNKKPNTAKADEHPYWMNVKLAIEIVSKEIEGILNYENPTEL